MCELRDRRCVADESSQRSKIQIHTSTANLESPTSRFRLKTKPGAHKFEDLLICGGMSRGVEQRGVRGFGLREEICGAVFVALMVERGADEGGEKRMRFEGLGFEFGVELAAEKPGVIGGFDNFDIIFVGRAAGDAQAGTE